MSERLAIRTTIGRAAPAVLWMALIFALSSREQLPDPGGVSVELLAILGHLFMYGVLTVLVLLAFGARRWQPSPAAAAFALVVAYGVSDEFHQSFVPGRHASAFDLLVDALASLAVLAGWAWWSRRGAGAR